MNQIQERIIEICENDKSQKDAIQSTKSKILVEAPAGYGKTRTLLLKCLYLLSEKKINDHKKTLIVTYTNNAVSKLKNDLDYYLEKLNLSPKEKYFFKGKIEIANFHSLSKRILSKYGYLIHPNLREIYKFNFMNTRYFNEKILDDFENFIKNRNEVQFDENVEFVLPILIENCNKNQLPYFGIIILLLKLFKDFKSIKQFYNKYYENIFIDEFQDINFLVNRVIDSINEGKENRYLFGDSLQTIFEFSGSDPELVEKYMKEFPENYIGLKNSHRLKDESLKYLEINLRTYYRTGKYNKTKINVNIFDSDIEEAKFILKKSREYFEMRKNCAILVGTRNGEVAKNLTDDIFFNALFEDENDTDNYFSFNEEVLRIFNNFLKEYPQKNNLRFFMNYFKDKYIIKDYQYENNYIHLLNSFINNYLMKEIYYLERSSFLKEVLEKNDLIKFVDYITDKIVLITIHKSKGLEWDNLFIINMNDDVLNFNSTNTSKIRENLRLFYVAVTRSKQKVFFSYNLGDNKKPSSFFNLPFLEVETQI